MLEKIKKAAYERALLRKAFKFIIFKFPIILLTKLEWCIGCCARWFFAPFEKIASDQIMFIPFQGDYTCNPKYIAEELIKRDKKYRMVFSARQASVKRRKAYPKGVRLVEQYSAEFYEEIMRSRILIVNSVEFLKQPTPLKKGQVLIETWHGSLGIKRFGEKENHGRAWVKAAKRCGKRADFIISNSEFEDRVYRETFWKKTPILRYGHPRNDILFLSNEEITQKIRSNVLGKKYEELKDNKLALYAPTFRDDHQLGYYNIDYELLQLALEERFGGTWKVLVRLHPTVRKADKKFKSKVKGIDVTSYPDIQELMLISDVAITDYSSWIYDFILTGRPGFIFATDIDKYDIERGFYYPLSSTPFPVAQDNDELIENIINFDQDKYSKDLELFLRDKGCIEDGKASERVVDKIIELMEAK